MLYHEITTNLQKAFYKNEIIRKAVRAVIIQDGNILMIHSTINGDYKFPGGGIKPDETDKEALIREVREESGYLIDEIRDNFLQIVEIRESAKYENTLFKMVSFYYFCSVQSLVFQQNLDEYEKSLGFEPIWINIEQALKENLELQKNPKANLPLWLTRETWVLQNVLEMSLI